MTLTPPFRSGQVWLFLIFLVLGGLAFLIFGVIGMVQSAVIAEHAVHVDAVVVGSTRTPDGKYGSCDSGWVYSPVARFTATDGQVVTQEIDSGAEICAKPVPGTKVPVVYDSQDPSQVTAPGFWNSYGGPGLMIVAGLIFGSIATIVVRAGKPPAEEAATRQ
ncbi:MAG: DUF3592 domain-containing protein [Microbacteriaceae bacterium]|nr:DUF3592 domain-containing protein [Microbacteriaceae bacterium]